MRGIVKVFVVWTLGLAVRPMQGADRGRSGWQGSTAAESEFRRRSAMRAIVKVFVVGTLGLAGLLVPAGYVHPKETVKSCAAKGEVLCEGGHCGEKGCENYGKSYEGGQVIVIGKTFYMCDSCSGQFVKVRSQPPHTGREGIVPGAVPPATQGQPCSGRPTPPGLVAPPVTK